ncbi:MAG: hypothetical protein G3M70_07360 [Candidatus Nitronauta litoralis]|uniref:Uncharacterized protein n=1 Tax=Candidatus Nitronauta litoralis TaxID=2705533 RepID=A0A7T0G0A2_9BACT|nr:MAG: hypothetical protein G3M70_07360 [Candidatus Nitronauta litoralis]
MVEGLALGIAIIGAGLGILNTWKVYDRDRIKIKVLPMSILIVNPGHIDERPRLGIKIINVGLVSATITSVGLKMKDGANMVFMEPQITNGKRLPLTLEPRSSITVSTDQDPELKDFRYKNVISAFAQTECENTFTGKSKALKQVISRAKSAHG